jgi:hypothetical protein
VLGGQAVVNGDGEDAGGLVAAPRANCHVDLAQVLEQAALGAQLNVGRRPRPSPRHVRPQLSRGEDSSRRTPRNRGIGSSRVGTIAPPPAWSHSFR